MQTFVMYKQINTDYYTQLNELFTLSFLCPHPFALYSPYGQNCNRGVAEGDGARMIPFPPFGYAPSLRHAPNKG